MHVSKYAVCTFAIVIPVEKKEFQNDSLTFDIRIERKKERKNEGEIRKQNVVKKTREFFVY